jgi:DeoR/GlpR family transcriptional regulator of sugar metabolism
LHVRMNTRSVCPMERTQRFDAELTVLAEHGRLEVGDLARRLEVSDMTVRRDLEELERQGLLRRVHGGAVPAVSRSYEPPFAVRSQRADGAKRSIAAETVKLFEDGDTVLLDVGTTTLEVARALQGRTNLTVLTPSLPVANLLADEAGIRLICLGGVVRPGERSLVGALAIHALRQFYVDVCVLGVGGLDAEAGLTEFNLEDAEVKRAALERSRQLIVTADASKLGTVAFAAVAPASRIDVLVTDAPTTHQQLAFFRELDIEVRTV